MPLKRGLIGHLMKEESLQMLLPSPLLAFLNSKVFRLLTKVGMSLKLKMVQVGSTRGCMAPCKRALASHGRCPCRRAHGRAADAYV